MQSLLSTLRERAKTASPEELQQELLKIIKLARELKRNNPLGFYRPNPKQELFHASHKGKRWFIAANRSGKSEAGVVEDCWWALGEHPYRDVPYATDGWVVCQSYPTQIQAGGIQEKFSRYLPKHRIAKVIRHQQTIWSRVILTCRFCAKGPGKDETEPKCPDCGRRVSTISFKTYDQSVDIFAGAELDWIHFDEEPPQNIRDECLIRLSKPTGGYEWGTMTPVKGLSWTHKEIAKPFEDAKKDGVQHAEIAVFGASMYDNIPNISAEYIAKKVAECNGDKVKIKIRIFGGYTTLSGLVYDEWDSEVNEFPDLPQQFVDADGKIHPDYDVYVGIDTGYYFAAIFILVDYFANLWIFDEVHAEYAAIARIAPELKRKVAGWGINPQYVIDKASSDDIELAEYGIYCTKAMQITREEGIRIVKNYIVSRGKAGGHPMLLACRKRVPVWLDQLASYQLAPAPKTGPNAGEQKGDVVKKKDHGMDASRFVISKRPSASRPSPGRDSRSLHQRTVDKVKKEIKEKGEDSEDRLIYEGV